MNSIKPVGSIRGRGARSNIEHRFSGRTVEVEPAEPVPGEELEPAPGTQIIPVQARSIITRNQSPDVGFDRSVNPYQGCEHGCVYCFARPTHAFHDLSPGLDFETRILAKVNAVERFRVELAAPSWHCEPIAVGVNTDAYQPAERRLGLTRGLLEVALECRQPVMLITKSALILRDADLLAELAARNLVRVAVSLTTLDDELKRRLEPRTAGPAARLGMIRKLSRAGVPVSAMIAPVIPRINDHEIEALLEAAAEHGALGASWVLLRLPLEVAPLFADWLGVHYPLRAKAVLHTIEEARGGRLYDARFHHRMRGQGEQARMIARRFETARRRLGLDRESPPLDTSRFRRPGDRQLALFDGPA